MPGAEDPIPTANSKPNSPGQTLTDEHFLSPSTTHSFPPPFTIQASKAAATQRTIHSVGPLVLLLVAAGQLVNQSRPLLVQRICGSQTQAAAKMATFASLGGLSEFILNPLMGRLSDRFGRRPILMSCAVLLSAVRALVFAFPHTLRSILVERMLSSAVITAFFSTLRAMLNDQLDRAELVVAAGAISIYAGAGLIFGPYIEVLVLQWLGPRSNFLVNAVVNGFVAVLLWGFVRETLPIEEQKPLTLKDCTPLTSILQILRLGSVNRRLMLVLLLQSFGEERVNQDINQFNLRENLGWSPSQISTYQAIWGVSVLLGGVTVKSSIERLGFSGHTTLSNCALAFGFYCQGLQSKYTSQLLALAMSLPGGRKRDAVETACSELVLSQSDMGRGQVSAALSNFKSLAMVLGPPVQAQIYTFGRANGMPGLAYRIIAITYLFAEAVHLSIGTKLEDLTT